MEEKMDCAWEAYQAYSNYCGQVPKEWPGLRTVEAWTAAVAPLVARLEKAEKLNEFFRESVGECHLMVSRDTPEYQGDKKHWESTTLPPRVSGLIAERAALRARVAELEIQLAEANRWYPISEAHEDHGVCVFVNIDDPGVPVVSHICDVDFSERKEVCGWTHFQPIRLSTETAERLMAEMKGGE